MSGKDGEQVVGGDSEKGQTSEKAGIFFERAKQVALTDNFDYAIDLYFEGLRCAPEALEQGHIGLYELALSRQAKGGRKPSMAEKIRCLRGKTALDRMLNAEYLFAKDPGHLAYSEQMLKAAIAGGYKRTARWIADLIFQKNSAIEKSSLQTYLLLKDSYEAIGQLGRAVVACQFALGLKPEDGGLADEYQRLSAEFTVSKGKYDIEGDFRQSINDRETQERLQSQESVVKTEDYRLSAVKFARAAMEKEPNLPGNIFNLAQALSELETDEGENEAIGLLEDASRRKTDFSFAEQAGRIRIKQLRRKIRQMQAVLDTDPDNEQAKSGAAEMTAQLDNTELEHYRLCVANYPTDLRAKYEYGVRLLRNKQYNEAIPLLQEAQRDPRHKIGATNQIGLCFFFKGWFADAIDVFEGAIDSYEIKDDDISKELRYNLGRSYEEQGNTDKAMEIYRRIAQMDFAYKDVSRRIDKLRSGQKSS